MNSWVLRLPMVASRNVSTILRQPTVEFKLGFSAFSATAVRLD